MTTSIDTVLDTLSEWQEILGLQNWKIKVEFAELDSDILAVTHPHHQYNDATIEFDLTKLMEFSPDDVERTVIHELLHCVDRERSNAIEEVEEFLSPDAFRMWMKMNDLFCEAEIDKLATILYSLRHDNDK